MAIKVKSQVISSVASTTKLVEAFERDQSKEASYNARHYFKQLIQPDQYVGEVFSLGYESALVQIHDFHRQKVGGIPSQCFLLASRVDPKGEIDYKIEDSSAVLLRVLDAAALPNEVEALRVRVERARDVAGDNDHWDSPGIMDPYTNNLLSYAGIKCRVLGTFYVDRLSDDDNTLVLKFGSDISNYYPNRGLKVYKPNAQALSAIVNYRDPNRSLQGHNVEIGKVRYASTNRGFQAISDVPVSVMPEDLLGQKTALFGMTRSGKSNTTKIMMRSVFELRYATPPSKIGQLIFDPNGEYANENTQDAGKKRIATAIKNLWSINPAGKEEDVVTYGIIAHPNDPKRKFMLLNFFEDANLAEGKSIIDAMIASDGTKYLSNFRQVKFGEKPKDPSGKCRYERRVLFYRAILAKAGFDAPASIKPVTKGLFNSDFLNALHSVHPSAASVLRLPNPSWSSIAEAGELVGDFVTKAPEYAAFNDQYIQKSSTGEAWADEDLKRLLGILAYPNGTRLIGQARPHHSSVTARDYAEDIYDDLLAGRLVIVDQSSGDSEVNRAGAERIANHIFSKNQQLFRQAELNLPNILIYVEEAHNLLPSGSDLDSMSIWVRIAKEGAKYNLGLLYATQEVSSIHKNILKNTSNWFIGHLNNTDETKELVKYYDFDDFESSIRRAQDKGFLRVKTLSNFFVVPTQVNKFEI